MVVHVVRRLMRYRQNLLCRISSLKLRGTEEGIQCLQHKRLKPDVQAWGLARVSSTERGWKRKKKNKLTETDGSEILAVADAIIKQAITSKSLLLSKIYLSPLLPWSIYRLRFLSTS